MFKTNDFSLDYNHPTVQSISSGDIRTILTQHVFRRKFVLVVRARQPCAAGLSRCLKCNYCTRQRNNNLGTSYSLFKGVRRFIINKT